MVVSLRHVHFSYEKSMEISSRGYLEAQSINAIQSSGIVSTMPTACIGVELVSNDDDCFLLLGLQRT